MAKKYTTLALGEEHGPPVTTEAFGEEEPSTTLAVGEEDPYTTLALGEEDEPTTSSTATSPFGAF